MALLNEISQAMENIANKLHISKDELDTIIDKYTDYVLSKDIKEILDYYVNKSVRDTYYSYSDELQMEYIIDKGEIISGLLFNENLNNIFINWYNDNYFTYQDQADTYNSIHECIKANFDTRMEHYVLSVLINNGLEAMSNIDNIIKGFENIDYKHDKIAAENKIPLTSREFDKACLRTGYKLANNFNAADIIEYISKDLDFKYSNDVQSQFYILDSDKEIKVTAANNKDMVEALAGATQVLLDKYLESSAYIEPEQIIDDMFIQSSNYSDYEIVSQLDEVLENNLADAAIDEIKQELSKGKSL